MFIIISFFRSPRTNDWYTFKFESVHSKSGIFHIFIFTCFFYLLWAPQSIQRRLKIRYMGTKHMRECQLEYRVPLLNPFPSCCWIWLITGSVFWVPNSTLLHLPICGVGSGSVPFDQKKEQGACFVGNFQGKNPQTLLSKFIDINSIEQTSNTWTPLENAGTHVNEVLYLTESYDRNKC